jgi:parvulin-like peptidyl-prolyl isomerase
MKARMWSLQILASAALLALGVNQASAQGKGNSKAVATVDGVSITMAEVEAVLKQAEPSSTPLTEAQKKQMRMEAVLVLVDDILMQQFLQKNGPTVEVKEINKKLTELQEGLKKQNKTVDDFLKETGQTKEQVQKNVKNMLQWTTFVKQRLTEDDLKRYYEENKDYFDRVTVRASHIVIRVSPSASESERENARAKLIALRHEIDSGKLDFAEAAKKHSQCSSAPNGGDIGFFLRKMAVEEPFARAAFALKVGEISDVVQTGYGCHLIKVTDRKPGQPSDYTKMKEEVREMCIEEMRMALLAQQRKTAHVEIHID